MTITELKADPKTAIKSKPAAVVVFYAEWCHDSRASEAYERTMAEDFKGKVEFFRLDVSEFGDICDAYEIENYPTYIFFRKGRAQRGRLVEPYSEDEVRNWIEIKLSRKR